MNEPCEYHCETVNGSRGWLPVDGECDEVDGMRLLIPTAWTACSCNPLHSQNSEMEAVVV